MPPELTWMVGAFLPRLEAQRNAPQPRYGGEELIAVLPAVDLPTAKDVADRRPHRGALANAPNIRIDVESRTGAAVFMAGTYWALSRHRNTKPSRGRR